MGLVSAEILNNLFILFIHIETARTCCWWDVIHLITLTCLWNASVLYDADDPGLAWVILCCLQVKRVTHCIDQLSDTDEATL